MPVSSITVTDLYVEVNWGGEVLHFDFANFPPSANTNLKRQQHITEHAQRELFDTRQRLTTLPDDDPDKTIDPGLPTLFWEGTGGNTDLVARSIVIEDVVYDDTLSPPLSFTLRRL